jgi:hypothetical protein
MGNSEYNEEQFEREKKEAILRAKLEVCEDVFDGEFMTAEEMEDYVDDLKAELEKVSRLDYWDSLSRHQKSNA